MSVVEAVRKPRLSLRPILMTTLTTVFGLAPLVLIPGAGRALPRPRSRGTVGLVCSTVVTLTFLPSALVELLQWRRPASR